MTTIHIDVVTTTKELKKTLEKLTQVLNEAGVYWTLPVETNSLAVQHEALAVRMERKLAVEVRRDADPESPRTECPNHGIMYCRHGRYTLGDRDARDPDELDPDEIVCKLPLYLLDHSGISMSTGSFNDPWDSGQVGWIYLLRKHAEAAGIAPENYERCLRQEVETYDHYLQGNVWGYQLGNGDACWGFYGATLEETGMLDEVPEQYRENLKKAWEERR